MLKVNLEKFDEMIVTELTKDDEYNNCVSNFKVLTNNSSNPDDALINSLVLKVSEIIYSRGFKDGMNFIINREDVNLFDSD